jgi:hypothetical protein
MLLLPRSRRGTWLLAAAALAALLFVSCTGHIGRKLSASELLVGVWKNDIWDWVLELNSDGTTVSYSASERNEARYEVIDKATILFLGKEKRDVVPCTIEYLEENFICLENTQTGRHLKFSRVLPPVRIDLEVAGSAFVVALTGALLAWRRTRKLRAA